MNQHTTRTAVVSIAAPTSLNASTANAAPLPYAAPSGSAASRTQSHEHAPKLPTIATQWQAAWNSADTDALAALFTPDGVYIDNGVGKTSVGTAQITGWKVGTDDLIAGVHLDVTSAHRHGSTVIIHSRYSGHINGAPNPFSIPGKTVLELRHGKITRNTDNYDGALLLSQSGLPATWTPGS